MSSVKVFAYKPETAKERVGSVERPKSRIAFEGKTVGTRSRKVVQWFEKFTSIGGFTQERDSDNKLSRLVWSILFLAGLALTLLGIVNMVIYFCQFNITTNIALGHNTSGMVFPSVAVCNQNRIHCGHLYDKILICSKVGYLGKDLHVHLCY